MASLKEINPDIGFDAGGVFNHLSNQSDSSVVKATTLKEKLDMSTSQVYLAIGWLAREDKVDVLKKQNSVRVRLK
jgi:predicted Kef-type K+ transport protein